MSEIHSSPFVGLVPYSEAQAPFFFGREAERDLIIENLRASRLTLLYGTSGVGKSSVLRAGAAYRLRQIAQQSLTEYGVPEFVVVTFNAWRDDPVAGLMRSIQEAIADALQVKSREAVPESRNLAQMMRAWSERYGIELLIILDQFEEYFLYRPNETGAGTFAEEFPRAVNDLALRARFLISLRDDALSKLDFFKAQIPNLFNNLLRIEHMNSAAASEAIVRPLDAYNNLYLKDKPAEHYSIEPRLVKEVIKQVATDDDLAKLDKSGKPSGDRETTRIETPYLQLVMTRLWDKEREGKSRVLRLQTLEDLKGIKNIVQVHLNNALEDLSPEQQVIAARIFDYLVTPSGTKIAYFRSDLVKKTKIAPEKLDGVLEALNKTRILRPVDPPPDRPNESRYEVFHDVLAQAILSWQTQYTKAAELVEAERQRRAAALARQALVLRRLVAGLVIAVIAAVAVAVYAVNQRSRANLATDAAEEARKSAQTALDAQTASQAELKLKAEELESALHSIDSLYEEFKDRLTPEERATYETYRKLKDDKSNARTAGASSVVPTITKHWQNGKTLNIRFMDGAPDLRKRVEEVAQEWTRYANLKFSFDSASDAEIRISFEEPGTSWSYVGTDALTIPQDEPTMSFGLLKEDLSEQDFRQAVLHEFGHVFGLIHEHQNPNANIPWDKEAVYRFFAGPPNNWDRSTVDSMLFDKYSGEYREFDRESIMMYVQIPTTFLTGNSFPPILELSTELSASDKEFVGKLYPK